MDVLPIVSIVLRLLALGLCVVAWRRLPDWRTAFLTALIALAVVRQAANVLVAASAAADAASSAALASELVALVISAMAVAAAVILPRSVARSRQMEEELQASRSYYRRLFQSSLDMAAVASFDAPGSTGRLLDVNPRTCSVLGYERDELLRMSFADVIVDMADAAEKFVPLADRIDVRADLELRAKDGRIIPVDIYARVVSLEDQLVIFSTARDISERKAAERKLQESTERLEAAEAMARLGHLEQPAGPGKCIWSDNVFRILGADPDTVPRTTESFLDFVHPDDRSRFVEDKARIAQGVRRTSSTYRVVRPDGVERVIRVEARAILGEAGQDPGARVTIQDVSEFEEAMRELGESRERFRQLAENIPQAYYLYDWANNEVLYISPSFEQLFGISLDELYADGTAWMRNIHPDDIARVRKVATSDDLAGPPGETISYRIMRPDGSTRWINARGFRVSSNSGELRVAGVLEDITDRRNSEQLLRSLGTKVALAEERERRRIAAELHDRTIQNLGLSRFRLAELRDRLAGDDSRPLLDAIMRLVETTIGDTRALLTELSPPVLSELGLSAAVEWLVDGLEERTGIVGRVESEPAPEGLDQDMEVVLFQAARELLGNVERHSAAAHVSVTLRSEDGVTALSVTDDGRGFDPDAIGAGPTPNGGFGLFNIRERLTLLGGDMQIDSKVGSGAQVLLRVPETTLPRAAHGSA